MTFSNSRFSNILDFNSANEHYALPADLPPLVVFFLICIQCPMEVKEMLIIKSYALMYKTLRKMAPYSKPETYINMASVCCDWRDIINDRPWFKRTIKLHFGSK